MAGPTSFSFTDEFRDFLDKTSKESQRSRTQFVVDAVTAYANGQHNDTLLRRIDSLTVENKALRESVDQIRTLCLQILANQQKGN